MRREAIRISLGQNIFLLPTSFLVYHKTVIATRNVWHSAFQKSWKKSVKIYTQKGFEHAQNLPETTQKFLAVGRAFCYAEFMNMM